MKIKLLLLSLLFFVEISFAQNYVTYSSKSGIVTTNSGIEGSFDIVISCYGSSGIPVILNQHFLCGDPDGFVSNLASNGLSLIPGQTTTLKFKFKKTVTSDTQKVYKFTTNGSCFQNESEMIKITVNYKNGSTTTPTNPTNPTNPNPEPNLNKITYNGIPSNYVYKNEGNNSIWIIGTDMGPNITYQWFKKYWAGTQPDVKIVGATGKDYLPTDFDSFNYWRRSYNASKVVSSNAIEITVIKAPKLENNILTVSNSAINGSSPTGGIGSYQYSWMLWGAEDPYTFPDTGQSLELLESIYNYMNWYPNAYIVRYVSSGSQILASNQVRLLPVTLPVADIQNNTISVNGYQITGSQPTGGGGDYRYSWFLSSTEDPIWFEETTKDLDLTKYPLVISWMETQPQAQIFRRVTSIKSSNSNTISLYGASALKQQVQSEDSLLAYPNPTSESVNFATNFGTDKEIEILVYSENLRNEKSIFKGKVTPNQVINWNIPSNYQKGIYFYKMLSGNREIKTGKIIFQ